MGYRKVGYFEQLLYIIENLIERRIKFIMTGEVQESQKRSEVCSEEDLSMTNA